ncbi:hypothetical protein CYMTET_49711 [Cymbomonas tetramitiformis]|uniref:Uncharacterized protein n=1 Tax=Cymbomonas tetramitiformis TaxID=36881 RepID=A0AAE0BQZ2_9CHLO|nr:hypothetical protein CYMTET_49711 [Cymbomonas tetramitiformis]
MSEMRGTCHKCAASLSRGTVGMALQCPTCLTRYHTFDCGQRFAALGLQASLSSCPKCCRLCTCSGGNVLCHAGSTRMKKRQREEPAAGDIAQCNPKGVIRQLLHIISELQTENSRLQSLLYQEGREQTPLCFPGNDAQATADASTHNLKREIDASALLDWVAAHVAGKQLANTVPCLPIESNSGGEDLSEKPCLTTTSTCELPPVETDPKGVSQATKTLANMAAAAEVLEAAETLPAKKRSARKCRRGEDIGKGTWGKLVLSENSQEDVGDSPLQPAPSC